MQALVVEPTRLYQKILTKILQEHGCNITVVDQGDAALSAIEDEKYDIAFIPRYLPDMNGVHLSMKMRATENGLVMPVLLLTSDDELTVRPEALIGGVTEVFSRKKLNGLSRYIQRVSAEHISIETITGHVLYVEDSMSVAMATKAMLESNNMVVEHYVDAESAWQDFQENEYDLVLTDLVLEGKMGGEDLIRKIRHSMSGAKDTPVLAMSGFNDVARRIELFNSGVNDYVNKPVLKEELWARAKNLVLNRQLVRKLDLQRQKLEQMATTDQLTGLYNRHFLIDIGPRKISESLRHKIPLSLVVVDVDKFKDVNDTYGHSTGDEVLQAVGKMMINACRNEDIAARFGGEEFVFLLSHCKEEDAIKKAEQTRILLSELMPAGLKVTASFGVASLLFDSDMTFSTLFDMADKAVYEAKESGRNCVRVSR